MHTGFRRPLSLAHTARSRRGFTLLEALIAVTLTLLLMQMVVTAFGMITTSVNDSRATVGINDKLRAVKHTLISDLSGVTVTMLPPRNPENGEGYFVYKEGFPHPFVDSGPPIQNSGAFKDEDNDGAADDWTGPAGIPDTVVDTWDLDPTVGDHDDVIMFTTRKTRDTFAGFDGNGVVIESPVAEVAYFVRGTTLYRRTRLVAPLAVMPAAVNDYGLCDVSARMIGGTDGTDPLDRTMLSGTAASMVANTLGDLTKPENRFAHQPYAYPHSIDFWGVLGLPTLRETSHPDWPIPVAHNRAGQYQAWGTDAYSQHILPLGLTGTALTLGTGNIVTLNYATAPPAIFDPWRSPLPWQETNALLPVNLGTLVAYEDTATPPVLNLRGTEDVLMTNVLQFDVKAWDPTAPVVRHDGLDATPNTDDDVILLPGDPGYLNTLPVVSYGAYVDLGYTGVVANSHFSGDGGFTVGSSTFGQRIYDTWSTHFESDGVDNDDATPADPKVANPNAAGEAPPPYPRPLRGIQIRIRAFEPDSRQIRQVTIVHDFLPQ